MTQRTYPTLLRNLSKKEITVMDNQVNVTTLFPGTEYTVEAVEPWSYYSRYERVTWNADGSVDAAVRDDWHEPARGKWVLKAINLEGKDYEQVVIGGQVYNLPKGIPVLIGIEDVTDPMVGYQSLEIRHVERWELDPAWPGYIQALQVLEHVKIERPEGELAKIRAELEALAQEPKEA